MYRSSQIHPHMFPALRLVKADCAVSIRRPVRPSVDSVLSSFLEIEENAAPEDAEESRIAEGEQRKR